MNGIVAMKKYITLLTSFLLHLFALGQMGSLDPTFGDNGMVKTPLGAEQTMGGTGLKVILKEDSSYYVLLDAGGRAVLVNYRKDGALNTSFHKNGYSEPGLLIPKDAAIQSNGKIVVVGATAAYSYMGSSGFVLLRYNSDGSLDESFGKKGRVMTYLTGSGTPEIHTNASANVVGIQSDGKIVAAGIVHSSGNFFPETYTIALARYNPDGSLDVSFGNGGRRNDFLGFSYDFFPKSFVNALVIQGDGKIVIGGSTGTHDGLTDREGYAFTLIRYNPNGTFDQSFGYGGIVRTFFLANQQTPFDNNDATVTALSLQKDGKIVAAGKAYLEEGNQHYTAFALTRYNNNGRIDSTFGSEGKVLTAFPIANNAIVPAAANALAIQEDDKILAVGVAGDTWALARYHSTGTLDNGFANGGRLLTPFLNENGQATSSKAISVLVQTNGKIIAAGAGNGTFALARYTAGGFLDVSFSDDGKVTDVIRYNVSKYAFSHIAVQPDGKVLAAGDVLSRYNHDGTLDNAFGTSGFLTLPFAINAMTVLADGKILLQGSNQLARLLPNGSLDQGFGAGGLVTVPFSITSLVLQSDGKLLLSGSSLARLNANGTPDLNFGNDGLVTTPKPVSIVGILGDGKILVQGGGFGRYHPDGTLDQSFAGGWLKSPILSPYAASLQKDGKLVIVGNGTLYVQNDAMALTRYNLDGTVDQSFGGGKPVFIAVINPFNDGHPNSFSFGSLTIQKDDKIIVAWENTIVQDKYDGTPYTFAILSRFNADGSSEKSAGFGLPNRGDILLTSLGGLSILGDEKILAVGSAGSQFLAVRYNPDLSVDQSFGSEGVATLGEEFSASTAAITSERLYALGTLQYFSPLNAIAAFRLTNITPSIITEALGTEAYCQGANVQVPFTTAGTFDTSNTFTAQLSSASGDFSQPTIIGTLKAKDGGSIAATIPVNTPAGAGYRLRVVASSPLTTGEDNGSDLTIQALHTYYRDGDGDGFGKAKDTIAACELPAGYAELAGDCDDGNEAIYPGADGDGCAACTIESVTLYAGKGETYQWQVDEGNGFRNILDNQYYAGTTAKYLTIKQPPTSWAGYKYLCLITTKGQQSYSAVRNLKFVFSWQGNVSTAWENPLNWSCGKVPDEFADVKVTTDAPLILNTNVTVRSMTTAPGAAIIIRKNVMLKLKK